MRHTKVFVLFCFLLSVPLSHPVILGWQQMVLRRVEETERLSAFTQQVSDLVRCGIHAPTPNSSPSPYHLFITYFMPYLLWFRDNSAKFSHHADLPLSLWSSSWPPQLHPLSSRKPSVPAKPVCPLNFPTLPLLF